MAKSKSTTPKDSSLMDDIIKEGSSFKEHKTPFVQPAEIPKVDHEKIVEDATAQEKPFGEEGGYFRDVPPPGPDAVAPTLERQKDYSTSDVSGAPIGDPSPPPRPMRDPADIPKALVNQEQTPIVTREGVYLSPEEYRLFQKLLAQASAPPVQPIPEANKPLRPIAKPFADIPEQLAKKSGPGMIRARNKDGREAVWPAKAWELLRASNQVEGWTQVIDAPPEIAGRQIS